MRGACYSVCMRYCIQSTSGTALLLGDEKCLLKICHKESSGSVRTLFLDLLFLRPLTRFSARDHFSDVKNSSRSVRPQEHVSSQATRRKEISLDVVFRLCCLNSPAAGRLAVTGKAASKADIGKVATRSVPGFVFRTCVMHARVATYRRGADVCEHAKLAAPSPCCRKPPPPDDAVFEGARPSDATKMKSSPGPLGENRSTGRVATATTACAAGMSTSDQWSGRPDGFVKVEDENEGTGGRHTDASAHSRLPGACAGAAAAVGFAAASPTVAHLVCDGLTAELEPIAEAAANVLRVIHEQPSSTRKLRKVGDLRRRLDSIKSEARGADDALRSLLDSEDHLRRLEVSRFWGGENVSAEWLRPSRSANSEDIEILLESYEQELDALLKGIVRTEEALGDALQLMELHLASIRNAFLKSEIALDVVGVLFGGIAAFAGVSGMNIKSGWEDKQNTFWILAGSLCFLSCVTCCLVYVWFRRQKL
eukprot:XP_028344198.1 uncharacterized protein LOC114486114 isoform X2 [Physeter catodon]